MQDEAMVALGTDPTIHSTAEVRDCTFGRFCEVGERTRLAESEMGDYSYVVNDSDIIYTRIGKFVNIAAHVRINPGQHPMNRASQHHFLYRSDMYGLGEDDVSFFDWRRSSAIEIGHDAWIGHGAVIKGGVRIGTGAVVGSGAVVTRDVPDYTIVTGMPATPLRERFPQPVREALIRIAWWDWGHDRLAGALGDFRTLEAEAFCRKYDPA